MKRAAAEPDEQQRPEQDRPEHPQVAVGDDGALQVRERVVVGRRRKSGAVPVASRTSDRPARPDGEDGEHAGWPSGGPTSVQGALVVHVLDRGGVPAQQERLVVVVHRERAAGGQVRLGRGQRLLGQQVALQPQGGLPGQRGQRVGQREQDQVVPLVRVLQVGPAVFDVHADPAVLVGMTRVHLAHPEQQQRIDLDGIDVPGALGQGDRDVVARPGPDDQDVAQAARVTWRYG